MSLMSSSLLLQQHPPYLIRLTWIVFVMGGKWLYRCCFVGLLPPGLVQYCSQHSCVVVLKLFLQYIYIYIYIYIYYYYYNIYLIKQYRHPLSTHFCIYPFESLHQFYGIQWELVNKLFIISSPSTFCLILGHHQGYVYCKKRCDLCMYITTL